MNRLERWAPPAFVLIWSSGFLVPRFAFESSDILFFLGVRLFLAGLILAIITVALGESLRISRRDFLISLLIGLALHGLYLGGVWEAIAQGSSAGLAAVITSTQPLVVSLVALFLLKERLRRIQISGLFLGFAGVVVVLSPAFAGRAALTLFALTLLIIAVMGSTSATLLQRGLGKGIRLLPGTTYQFLAIGAAFIALSIARGRTHIEWSDGSIFAMAWAVLVTSIMAVLLLLWMLQRGSAAKISSLLYLVPPVTALQAWMLFGDKLNAQTVIGIAMTALGVALVQLS